jgi:predicted CXXCH cytochrome family protein
LAAKRPSRIGGLWVRLRRQPRLAIATIVLLLAGLATGGVLLGDWYSCLPSNARPRYVGSASCIECHREQTTSWRGSHHDLAMQRATEDTVLADFNDATFTHHDVTSRMFRKDGKFFVNTEGPDGEPADFEVKYVFGVEPLQQYMVEFDRGKNQSKDEIARLQVLRVSWDTHEKRWFYLPPPDVSEKLAPDDDLHWTGVAQRWNTMCADCHSTNLKKNYDAATGRYHTTFTNINVGCEACHGPGSLHVEAAKSKLVFWDRNHGVGLSPLKTESNIAQIEACAPCHSRRRILAHGYRPGKSLDDHFAVGLLAEETYHADGQIKDEVYEIGSFLQSKMFHKNVRCSDCHDPHSARLKREGNQLCTNCHVNQAAHPSGKYDTPAHHHHKPGSAGAMCVECHMPETTYMEIDARRDHSLRVPRPDLSVSLGVPNACSRCHLDKAELAADKKAKFKQYNDWVVAAERDPDVRAALAKLDSWAADTVRLWYDKKPALEEHFAVALDAARKDDPGAEERLIEVIENRQLPAIVRATAVSELFGSDARSAREAAQTALDDHDPLVRAAAVGALEAWPRRARAVAPLLEDSSLLVRTEAVRTLASAAGDLRSVRQRSAFDAAIDEYADALMVDSDRAGAHLALGVLHESLGDERRAERAYRLAMKVEPGVTGPRTNLAALLDRRSERFIQRSVQAMTAQNSASAENAKKWAIADASEAKRLRREELALLERDARLAPDIASLQYRYGLFLNLHDRADDAEEALKRAYELSPKSSEFALALAYFYQKHERWPEAIAWAERTLELRPEHADARQVLEELKAVQP